MLTKNHKKYLKAIVCGENVVVTQVTQRDRERRVSKMITHIECRARKQHHDQRKKKKSNHQQITRTEVM